MAEAFIHKISEISDKSTIKNGAKIWNNVQVRDHAIIGFGTSIGANSYIDKSVSIGNHCKIQNSVNIYNGVTIRNQVYIGQGTQFTNDKFPRAFKDNWSIEKTLVKKGASIGANCTILPDLIIGKYAMVGAGSVVTKDVPDYAIVVGNPARIIGYVDDIERDSI